MVAPISETIVVGVDGSECSEHAVQWAITEARRSDRPLQLIHVWHWSHDALASPMSLVGVSDARHTGRRILDRAAGQARHQGVTATTRLLEGSPPNTLAKAADGAAMLVVGSHGQRNLTKMLLGSVSRGCVQHARCPVVVLPARLPAQTVPSPAVSQA